MITLDHIDNIVLNPQLEEGRYLLALKQLAMGVHLTRDQMEKLHESYFEILYPDRPQEVRDIMKTSSFMVDFTDNKANLIAINLFSWYAISLINYANLVGTIQFMHQAGWRVADISQNKRASIELKNHLKYYLGSITELKPVIHFRNKYAAHLAFTKPYDHDNEATLIESTSVVPTRIDGKLWIGRLQMGRGNSTSSFSENEWNIVDHFESIAGRYFPKKSVI